MTTPLVPSDPNTGLYFNDVTPETEETSVTDVTASQGRDGVELSAAAEQVPRELTERARAGGLRLTGGAGCWGS